MNFHKLSILLYLLILSATMGCGSDSWSDFDDVMKKSGESDLDVKMLCYCDILSDLSLFDKAEKKSKYIACVCNLDFIINANDQIASYLDSLNPTVLDDEYYIRLRNRFLIPSINPAKETLILAKVSMCHPVTRCGFRKYPTEVKLVKRKSKQYLQLTCEYYNPNPTCDIMHYKPVEGVIAFVVNRPNLSPTDLSIDIWLLTHSFQRNLGDVRNLLTANNRKYKRIPFGDKKLIWD